MRRMEYQYGFLNKFGFSPSQESIRKHEQINQLDNGYLISINDLSYHFSKKLK